MAADAVLPASERHPVDLAGQSGCGSRVCDEPFSNRVTRGWRGGAASGPQGRPGMRCRRPATRSPGIHTLPPASCGWKGRGMVDASFIPASVRRRTGSKHILRKIRLRRGRWSSPRYVGDASGAGRAGESDEVVVSVRLLEVVDDDSMTRAHSANLVAGIFRSDVHVRLDSL